VDVLTACHQALVADLWGTEVSLAVSTCPDCGSHTKRHCPSDPAQQGYSSTCNWWACSRCFTYGNDVRAVIDKRLRGGS
jgi:hypothetical protein